MATTVTTTIKQTGGDHSTIAAWEADTDNDLVTADEVQVGELFQRSANAAWDERVTIAGATTDATRYRKLVCPTAERHDGTATGCHIAPTSSGHVFVISEDNFWAEGLRIHDWVGSSSEAFRINNTNFRCSYCVFHDADGSLQMDALYAGSSSITIKTWNCVFWNIRRGACHIQGLQSVTWYVYSCTGWNLNNDETAYAGFGFDDDGSRNNSSSVMHCKNVVSHTRVPAGDDFHGGGASGQEGTVQCTNCGCSDSSITTAGDVTNNGGEQESLVQADQYVSLTGSIDLHLKSGADLIDAGTDLSADANIAFSDDIDGDPRSGTWDIGADERVVAGGETVDPRRERYILGAGF